MTIRTNIELNEGIFSITFTCFNWLLLFELTNGYDIIYKQFDILKSEGHSIIGYVIMPNHIHFVIHFAPSVKNINLRIGTMKRFVAYELVDRLKRKKKSEILKQLEQGVTRTEVAKGKLHKVFEPSFDIKHCFNNWFIEQKLNYIHNNPCKGRWHLSTSPETYLHSSALFYSCNQSGRYEVRHYLDIL